MMDGLIKYIEKERNAIDKQLSKQDKIKISQLLITDEKLVKYIAYTTMLETFKMFKK